MYVEINSANEQKTSINLISNLGQAWEKKSVVDREGMAKLRGDGAIWTSAYVKYIGRLGGTCRGL